MAKKIGISPDTSSTIHPPTPKPAQGQTAPIGAPKFVDKFPDKPIHVAPEPPQMAPDPQVATGPLAGSTHVVETPSPTLGAETPLVP